MFNMFESSIDSQFAQTQTCGSVLIVDKQDKPYVNQSLHVTRVDQNAYSPDTRVKGTETPSFLMKNFYIDEHYNKPNGKVYVHSSKEASQVVGKVEHGHHPASVMVYWGMSYQGVKKLHFCEKGVIFSAKVHQETVLDRVVTWTALNDSPTLRLTKSLEQAVAKFPIETVRNSIDSWPARLKASIKAKGAHFK